MPAGGIHLCVGASVADSLNIDKSMSFFVGTVCADSWRNSSSTKMGTHFLSRENCLDYDYDFFYNKYLNYMNHEFVIGYLIHLITDKFWYVNNYVTSTISVDDYNDLKKLCSMLVKFYNIPKLELPDDLFNPIQELDSSGIIHTIDYLNNVNYGSGSSRFDLDELIYYIESTSSFVVSEINRLYNSNVKCLKKVIL